MHDHGFHLTTALLADGRVLVAGGSGYEPSNDDYYVVDSAQVYDPGTGSWTAIANMRAKASLTAAVLQPDGKVLVVGSLAYWTFPARIHAEVYDPATGSWTALAQPTGSNGSNGFKDIAALLSDGTVLMTDPDEDNPGPGPAAPCTAAALYDPRTGSTTTASSMLRCARRLLVHPPARRRRPQGRRPRLQRRGPVHFERRGRAVRPCRRVAAAVLLPAPTPPVFPSPTPVPTPLPPAAGPVPPNARRWTVTVDNRSSEPATLFVAGDGVGARRVGDAERRPSPHHREGDVPLPCQ